MVDKITNTISRVKYLVIFWSILALSFLLFDKINGQKVFLGIVVALILHLIITEGVIKHLLTKILGKRNRPYLANQEINPIGRKFTDSSFPSSHMATTVAVLSVVVYFYPACFFLALILGLFMAYARLHQGMHYLSDVLAGMLLGILYGYAAIFIVIKYAI